MTRPHVIPDLLQRFRSKLTVEIVPFTEIDLTLVEFNRKSVAFTVTDLEKIAEYIDSALDILADQVNALGGVVQFQRIVDQPVSPEIHREILSGDGVCLRYTVEPNDSIEVSLDCVAFQPKEAALERTETNQG